MKSPESLSKHTVYTPNGVIDLALGSALSEMRPERVLLGPSIDKRARLGVPTKSQPNLWPCSRGAGPEAKGNIKWLAAPAGESNQRAGMAQTFALIFGKLILVKFQHVYSEAFGLENRETSRQPESWQPWQPEGKVPYVLRVGRVGTPNFLAYCFWSEGGIEKPKAGGKFR